MTAETGHANPDAILCSGYLAIFTFRVILEAKHQSGQHLGIHLGQFHRPYLLDHLASAGAETATVSHFKSRLQRNGDSPTRMIHAHIGLVNPSASKVKSGGDTKT